MTVLHSVDFFPSGKAPVAIEPRLPQAAFPEHHHDFHEIVIVEHGTVFMSSTGSRIPSAAVQCALYAITTDICMNIPITYA
ncbi:L-rhamnose operon regulatory protein [Salmonella enterica subsp. arizonae]|uniref:L-rhamnose operon regulatory protein n=1 Tax=Salmonella enterica subsp. arizonae TaxID=59203 RepID=A0A379T1T2_SALER|nr:L-rhamnose operon regulatory protein [Salmonella enterica subsp. arizonae]